MKIVLLVHNLTGGGAERVAALWATGFAERGDKVTIVINKPTKTHYKLPSKVRVISITFPFTNRVINKLMRTLGVVRSHYRRNLCTILHSIQPDVCIGVMGSYAREAFFATRDINMRIIQTYHGSFDLPENAPPKRKKDILRCYALDSIIEARTVLTNADKEYIGDKMQKVFVMPNPLAFDIQNCVPAKENIILACGRLDVWDVKGFDLLIKAWGMICKKYPDWKLQIAGTGRKNSYNFLQYMVHDMDIDSQVNFLGFREDVITLYQRSAIFVLSSRYEGFGMVLIEAMSQGCACIACDYKGRQKEIIENSTQGLLCAVNSIDDLSTSIEQMISDDKFRECCQENALKRASNFTIEKTISRWDQIFINIGIK